MVMPSQTVKLSAFEAGLGSTGILAGCGGRFPEEIEALDEETVSGVATKQ